MQWFHAHLYTTLIAIAAMILLTGAVVVSGRSSVPPNISLVTAWGGTGGFLYPTFEPTQVTGATEQNFSELYRKVQKAPPFMYTPPTRGTAEREDAQDSFDFDAFLALLSRENVSGKTGSSTGNMFSTDASFFIPSSSATSAPPKGQTETQEALYEYGNEAGAYIQQFENNNKNMARVLKDQFEDPQSQGKAAALIELGEAIANVGGSLQGIENVPMQAGAANTRLVESYKAMGEKLMLVPEAETTEEKIAAMLAYNATAETFVKNYISLVTLFSIAGVTFSASDPGSVFTFSAASF